MRSRGSTLSQVSLSQIDFFFGFGESAAKALEDTSRPPSLVISLFPIPSLTVPADRLVEQEANCSESPANIGGVGPTAQPLTYCSYYANSTCCFTSRSALLSLALRSSPFLLAGADNFSESEAQENIEAKIGSLVGFGACYDHLKLLHCAWLCAPDQRDFITFDDKPGFPRSSFAPLIAPPPHRHNLANFFSLLDKEAERLITPQASKHST